MELIRGWFLMADGGDGAGGAAAGSDAGADAGVTGQDAADQDAGAQAQEQSPSVRDAKARKAEYDRLIKGEYRDLYQEDTQRIVKGRVKDSAQMKAQLDKLSPMLELMHKHYGTSDLDALSAAVTGDDRYYEDEAQRRGMDTETFKKLSQQEQTIREYREAEEARRSQEAKSRQVMQWRQEEAALREQYPDFNLDAEIEATNGELFRMLDKGISLEHAYKVLHMDEIMMGTLAGAVQRTAKRVADSVRANGVRPAENGAGKAPAKPMGTPVARLTPKQMDALEKRAARGETITPDMFG